MRRVPVVAAVLIAGALALIGIGAPWSATGAETYTPGERVTSPAGPGEVVYAGAKRVVVTLDDARTVEAYVPADLAPEATPTPSPTATATPVAKAWEGCGKGNWPPGSWRPFAAGSAFNTPVPADPGLLTNSAGYTSAQMVSWLTARGPTDKYIVNTGGSWDYAHPYYCAAASDPEFTLKSTKYKSANDDTKIRIPTAALPRSAAAAGGDAHITIIQPDGDAVGAWQYAGVSAGVASASAWARDNVDTGDGVDNFTTTAAWFNNLAGIIRAQELEAGVIDHALFVITNCTWADAVPPAHEGTTAKRCTSAQAAPPLGARLQLDPAYTLPSGLPAWKYPILRALQKYGAIIGDTGAYSRSISFGLQMESGQMYISTGDTDRLAAWAEAHRAQGDIAKGTNGSSTYYSLDFGKGVDWTRLRVVI